MSFALEGVLPMLVTPFGADGAVDLEELSAVAEHQLEAGVAGLSALGLGGEVGALSVEERGAITARAIAVAAGAPVVVGCSAGDTDTSRGLATAAADQGASAIMVAPPGGGEWSREQLFDHYAAVAEAITPVPMMVQDAPALLGVALDAQFVIALARGHANVRYAKPECVPAADAVSELAALEGIAVFGGHGGLYLLEVLEVGADGIIPGCEHPAGFQGVIDAWGRGDRGLAQRRFAPLLPLLVWQFQSLECFIASAKTILAAQGLISEPLLRDRPWPLGPRSQEILMRRAAEAGALAAEVLQ